MAICIENLNTSILKMIKKLFIYEYERISIIYCQIYVPIQFMISKFIHLNKSNI